MQKRNNYNAVFLFFFGASIILLILWKGNVLKTPAGFISKIFLSPRSKSISLVNGSDSLDIVKVSKSLDTQKLQQENQALRDQFAVSSPRPSFLIPAKIIGAPTFIPTQTIPTQFILDKGENDGIRAGQSVILGNNLVGQISKTSSYSSKVVLVIDKSVSFTGKIESGAIGVVKGLGDLLEIDNILLSENISKNGLVLTKGNQDLEGLGFPPDLIVGKILSVNKNPSALFQKAEVKSLVNFTRISTVFVVIK